MKLFRLNLELDSTYLLFLTCLFLFSRAESLQAEENMLNVPFGKKTSPYMCSIGQDSNSLLRADSGKELIIPKVLKRLKARARHLRARSRSARLSAAKQTSNKFRRKSRRIKRGISEIELCRDQKQAYAPLGTPESTPTPSSTATPSSTPIPTSTIPPTPLPEDFIPMQTAHRIEGIAPLAVFFDAVDSASWQTSVIQPPEQSGNETYRDYSSYRYLWNFGDPDSATWERGRSNFDGSRPSKNSAQGFVAAHVYELPGDYQVTLSVLTAEGATLNYYQTIRVLPFTGTTYYVSNSSGNDAWDGLAPSFQGGNRGPIKSFAMAFSKLSTNTRTLFKRGDTWNVSSGELIGKAGPGIIGAYGEGAKPKIINNSSDNLIDIRQDDWRLLDLQLIGQTGDSSGTGIQGNTNSGMDNVLLLGMEVQNFRVGIGWSKWQENYHRYNFIVDCKVEKSHVNGVYVGSQGLAVLGSSIKDISSSHVLRVWQAHKAVISNNDLLEPGPTRHALKLHGPEHGSPWPETKYVVFSDNIARGKTWPIGLGPQNNTSDERISHVLFERNLSLSESSVRQGLSVWARHVTIRNNIFDASGAASDYSAVYITRRGIEPSPYNVQIYNNTMYRGDSSDNFIAVLVDSPAQNVKVQNNLASAPLSDSKVILEGSASLASHNLLTDSPGFIEPSSLNFGLLGSSQAIDAGLDTNLDSDYQNNLRMDAPDLINTGSGSLNYYDIGAVEYMP